MVAMNLSSPGAGFLRHHEGFVDHWYLDPVNVPTIGVGFTWRSESFREWWAKNRPGQEFKRGAQMTRDEADDALQFLVAKEYGAAVNKFLSKKVAQHVFDGSVSPVFNLGAGSLKWKWAAALKAGEIAQAAKLLRTTGTTAQGKKLAGLVTRRREESELIALGDYTVGKVYADPLSDGLLVRGERGQPVIDLQKALAARNFYKGEIDGLFGYGTEAAVLDFQRANNLVADGYAGPKTLAVLTDQSAPTAPETVIVTTPIGEATATEQPARGGFGKLIAAIGSIIAMIAIALVQFFSGGGQ